MAETLGLITHGWLLVKWLPVSHTNLISYLGKEYFRASMYSQNKQFMWKHSQLKWPVYINTCTFLQNNIGHVPCDH